MPKKSDPLPQPVRGAIQNCKSRLADVTKAIEGLSANTAPTKRQLNAVDGKKGAYRKAFDALCTTEAMWGLTAVASSEFIAGNSVAIQEAGLANGAASTSTANAGAASESHAQTVSGDTATGHDIATVPVSEGGQGPDKPAGTMVEIPSNSEMENKGFDKEGDAVIQQRPLPDANANSVTFKSVGQAKPAPPVESEPIEARKPVAAIEEDALIAEDQAGISQAQDEANKKVAGKRPRAQSGDSEFLSTNSGVGTVTFENGKRKKQRTHGSGTGATSELRPVPLPENEEPEANSDDDQVKGKGKRAAKRKFQSDEAAKYDTEESESEMNGEPEQVMKSSGEPCDKNVKFGDLDDEGKRKMAEEVKKEVLKCWFGDAEIPAKLRRLIRENQSVVPEAATKNRKLALECLTTQNFNVFCPYHHANDKGGKKMDGKDGQKYVLNGVPLPRETVHPDAVKVLKKKSSALYTSKGDFRSPRLRSGYLNCGCEIDEALMNFYFWKTWTLTGIVDGEEVTESMGEQRLTPRIRAFVVKNFMDWTCLTLDDLYTGSHLTPEHHQEAVYLKQLERILAKYNAVREKLGRSPWRLEGELEVPGADNEF